MQGKRKVYGHTWRQIVIEKREKELLHRLKGQVNSKSKKSKGVIKGQGVQRCEESSKLVNFIF